MATTGSGCETLTRGKQNLKPTIGLALSALLHARAPRKANFMQTLFSIQLWRGGVKKETLSQISHAGLCLGYKGTLNAIDGIRKTFDSEARRAKDLLQEQLSSEQPKLQPEVDQEELDRSMALYNTVPAEEDMYETEDEMCEYGDASSDEDEEQMGADDEVVNDGGHGESEDDAELSVLDISGIAVLTDESSLDEPIEIHPGFTTCWDNVGKKVITRNPTDENTNTYMNMALGYMAINRVPVTHLDAFGDRIPDTELPMSTFVPNDEDFNERDFRLQTVITRLLCRHIPWFSENFSDCVVHHIIHSHSNEMRRKSVIVNLGVFDENSSITSGAIGIYRKLQEYVPTVDGKPYPTLVYGDGLSCERGTGAHKACTRELDAWKRLEGLEPSPQEFHKEMMLVQDFFKEFCKDSAADHGTLSAIKNNYNFRQVKPSDISNCFSDAWELMCLATETYTSLAAISRLGLHNLQDRPQNAPKE